MSYALLTGNLLMAFTVILKFSKLPPQLPIFYSRPWGEGQIADWWLILILPILMNALYALNLFIAKKFFADDDFVKNILRYLNLLLVIAFTVIFLKIIFLTT